MKTFLLLLAFSFCTVTLFAQNSSRPKHLPAAMTPQERELAKTRSIEAAALQKSATISTLPSDFHIPGEWEESQAVLVEWPYDSLEYSSKGLPMTNDEWGFGNLWLQLVDAIQQECPVWIVIWKGKDSLAIKQFMTAHGHPLVRYRFFVPPSAGDAFWARDFGPIGFYYGDRDSIGFVDLQYYEGRNRDNLIPSYLAGQLGYLTYPTALHTEGGNFMTDGYGHGYFSTGVVDDQKEYYGWSRQKTIDSIRYAYKLTQMTELPKLVCDGGTAHIDMYIKLLDEETFAVTRYPSVVTASDRQTIDNNITLCKSLTSATGYPYRLHEFSMPTEDDGQYATECDQIFKDARGYINGVFVNKTYIVPIYSHDTSGSGAADLRAVQLYQQLLPGYKIVPIDARLLSDDYGGGAIHCVTMQIPAENPIRFLHHSITGSQPLQSKYDIMTKITNRDGIKQAVCKWRKKGSLEWTTEDLTQSGSGSGFQGAIPNMGFVKGDTVEYYLEAESNNSKKMAKPITAPDGYYSFIIDNTSAVYEVGSFTTHLLEAYPNPAQEECVLPFMLESHGQAVVRVTDITGREEVVLTGALTEGFNSFHLSTAALAQGVHFYSLSVNGKFVQTSRFVVVK